MKYIKHWIILILILTTAVLTATESDLKTAIEKYSGTNAEKLINLIDTQSPDTLKYINFILKNSSPFDLSVITADYLMENLRITLQAKELPFNADIPDDIFYHFVLPLRISQEPFELWRPRFYQELFPLVKNCATIEDAIQEVNWWIGEHVKFTQTNGRDQAPLTSLRRGYGRCEEIMIMLIAALRSVGIPARSVSAPYWNHMDNNHAWEEVWTPDGWSFMAGWGPTSIPEATWFSQRAATTTIVSSHAFGYFDSPEIISQKDNVSLLSAIGNYTVPIIVNISVVDSTKNPLPEASIMLYGISFGGLFPMLQLDTDSSGSCSIPMGRGGCFVSAEKDSLIGYNYINLENTDLEKNIYNIEIMLSQNNISDFDFQIKFPPPLKKPLDWIEPTRTNEHKLRSEIAGLRFDRQWNNRLKQQKFLDFYDTHTSFDMNRETYLEQRKFYLEQSNKLAESTADYLKIIDRIDDDNELASLLVMMIADWDIKELVELPDTTSIYDVIDILHKGRSNFSVPDSIWRESVLNQTFSRVPCPENGWRRPYYQTIKHLLNNDFTKTFDNVIEWVDNTIEIDSSLVWTYFTGVRDPMEILNMKYVSRSDRLYLINNALVLLGVPTQWTGFLSYYNGEEFIPIKEIDEEPVERIAIEKTISMFNDGVQIQSSAWSNFLVAEQNSKGVLQYIFFEEERDSLSSKIEYSVRENAKIFIESYVRNSNGDANIKIINAENNNDSIRIDLHTPIEYFNNLRDWDQQIVSAVKELRSPDKRTLIFIQHKKDLEPQQRMLSQIREKKDAFKKKNIEAILYSENRKLSDNDFNTKTGNRISSLDEEEYPLVFLLDEEGNIIFSVNGYYMGIADILLRQF